MDRDLPTQALRDRWEDVVTDLDATAEELRADGWTTVALHPGDVTTRVRESDASGGFDVMVASNEFDALEAQIEAGAAFEETAVFRRAAGGVMFLVCVLRDPEREVAALVPVFYPQQGEAARALAERTHDAGELHVFVRPLDRERVVTFTIEDPGLVFPTE